MAGSQYFSTLSEMIEYRQVEQSRRRRPVCRWCDKPVVHNGTCWVHEAGYSFVLYCPRCQRNTRSDSNQADCRRCGYNIGDNHLAEPRR